MNRGYTSTVNNHDAFAYSCRGPTICALRLTLQSRRPAEYVIYIEKTFNEREERESEIYIFIECQRGREVCKEEEGERKGERPRYEMRN